MYSLNLAQAREPHISHVPICYPRVARNCSYIAYTFLTLWVIYCLQIFLYGKQLSTFLSRG